MQIGNVSNNVNTTTAVFTGCKIEKDAAKYILNNVISEKSWKTIDNTLPKLEKSQLRDFNFKVKRNADGDEYLRCEIDAYSVTDRFQKKTMLTSHTAITESEDTSITDIFRYCADAADAAEITATELANKFARKYFLN